ncbi:MAG: hydantoinase/oxoprolinase family protein [Gemmatimonadota bacterium]
MSIDRRVPEDDERTASDFDPAGPRVGVDIGGTFTDFVFVASDGELRTHKVLSTPDDPAEAVLRGLDDLLEEGAQGAPDEAAGGARPPSVVHGSTVATNALLERRGARVAFVTSAGFGDLLRLGRQARPELYDLHPRPPDPLVPAERCYEVDERVDRDGRILRELDEGDLQRLVTRLEDQDVESVAVCLLFSFLSPGHERRVAERLREAGLRVSTSSRILPEFREFERASTTVANAYVTPVLDRYLGRLRDELPTDRFRIMQSSGGSVGVERARAEGVRSVLSGPAGGVVGAVHVARSVGAERVLTFDMGGTSTDVSVAEGDPAVTTEAEIGGVPVAVPVVDLHTVGSGGGSVARVDRGGALRVGPESAGARPGPACYGRGGQAATVTDANLVLGRLDPDRFLGGQLPLDPDAARRALASLAAELGLEDRDGVSADRRAALGVVRVANARMERALRVISVERGHDPADFTLVSFGGAGGLHAADLARRLGVPRVLVPPAASVLSALGMLATDVIRDHGRTVMLPGDVAVEEVAAAFAPLVDRAREEMREEGVPDERVVLHRRLDLRYEGQSYEITVPFGEGVDPVARFHDEHASTYGHAERSAPVEIVNLRVRAVGRIDRPELSRGDPVAPDPSAARIGRRPVVLPPGHPDGGPEAVAKAAPRVQPIPFYDGDALEPGHRFEGPAVVLRPDTTVFVGSADRVEVDRHYDLVVEVGR